MKKNLKKGFTLTELVVVIVIIGILASVLIPTLTSYITRSRKSAAEQEATARLQEAAAYVLDKDNEAWFAWNEYMKGSKVEVKTSNGYIVLFDGGKLDTSATKADEADKSGHITNYEATLTFATGTPNVYTLTFKVTPTDASTLAGKLSKAMLNSFAGTLNVNASDPVTFN